MIAILIFIAALALLVLIHEAGHLLAAKWCGMHVSRFSLFFGPALWTHTWGETEYRIGCIPLGGYVKITGMTPHEDNAEGDVGERAYYRQSLPRRLAVILAGPAANIIAAFIIFVGFFMIGYNETTPTTTIRAVTADSPAQVAGLAPGDRITAVGGKRTPDNARVREALMGAEGTTQQITVMRNGVPVTLTARIARPTATQGRLGVLFESTPGARVREGLGGAVGRAGQATWDVTRTIAVVQAQLIYDEQARKNMGTIVGAGAVHKEAHTDGFGWFYIGALSLMLALFNLLPIFPLDGGQALIAIIERVRRRPLGERGYQMAMGVGLSVIALLMIVAISNDVGRFMSGNWLS